MKKTLAGAACVAAVFAATACSGAPAPLSSACKKALANEKAVVGGNNAAVTQLNETTALVPKLQREDQRAMNAVKTAGCPGTVKILMPD